MRLVDSSQPLHVIVIESNQSFHPGFLPSPWTRTIGTLPGPPVPVPPLPDGSEPVWFVAPRRPLDAAGARALVREAVTHAWPGLSLGRGRNRGGHDPEVLSCLRDAPHLRYLSLLSAQLQDEHLAALSGLPVLEWLDLRWNGVTDLGLLHLRRLLRLRFLGLCGNPISGAGLIHLCELPELSELWIGGTQVAPKSLLLLQDLPALRSLDVSSCKHDNVALAALGGLPGLEQLQITGEAMDGEGLRHLAGLWSLRHLSLHGMRRVGRHLRALRALPLQTLDLCRAELDERSLEALWGVPLRALALHGNADDAVFQHVGGLRELRQLRASQLTITSRSMPYLALCERLEELRLSDSQVGDVGLWRLSGLRYMRELSLLHLPITDESLRGLLGMQQLERLELVCCDIFEHGLAYLCGLPHLAWLELGAYHDYPESAELDEPAPYRLTDAGMRHVGGMRALVRLQLNGTLSTDAGLRELAGLRGLEFLSLHGLFTGEGLRHLKGQGALRDLLLRSPLLSQKHLRHLRNFPRLRHLSLQGAGIGDDGVRRYISQLKELQYLDLSRTGVCGKGLHSLRQMPTLEDVWLREVPLSRDGLLAIQSLAPAIEVHR